jgi:TrmH family RNA methyltransferase
MVSMNIRSVKQAVALTRNLRKRKVRSAERCFIVEGINFVEEALRSQIQIEYLLCTDRLIEREKGKMLLEEMRRLEVPLFLVSEKIFEDLAQTDTPQGVLAVGVQKKWPVEQLRQSRGLMLALDRLQDPGNLGTILRTSDAVGVQAIFLSEGTVDVYNSKVLRSTMGSVFRVPTAADQSLLDVIRGMKERGVLVVAADAHAATDYFRAPLKVESLLLVIGNEGQGIQPELLELADQRVTIPLRQGVESLNAAVATALVLYEIYRQNHS